MAMVRIRASSLTDWVGMCRTPGRRISLQSREGAQVLPQKEFQLLYKLASYPGRIFTRQQLMEDIWGPDSESDIHTVDVHVGRLRERLRDNPDLEIVTVRGLGYKAVRKNG